MSSFKPNTTKTQTKTKAAPKAASVFAGIGDAKASEGKTPTIPEGEHKVEVTGMKFIQSQKDRSKSFIILECNITESDNEKVKIGQTYSRVLSLSNVYALGELKQFLTASFDKWPAGHDVAIGEAEESEDSEALESAWEALATDCIGTENPLSGAQVVAVGETVQTKAGNPFLKMTWLAVEE